MWIDELKRNITQEPAVCGRVSIGGSLPAAETEAEQRGMKILRAGGALRIPAAGENQLILRCMDGEYVALGEIEGDIPEDMEPGEVYIKTENAAVLIKNSGRMIISGELEIRGSLTLNGREIDGA